MKAFLRALAHSLCRLLHNTLYNRKHRRRTLRAERRLHMATRIYGDETPEVTISVEMENHNSDSSNDTDVETSEKGETDNGTGN